MLQARTITKEKNDLIDEIISQLKKIPSGKFQIAEDIYVEFFDEDNKYYNLRIEEIHLINDEALAFIVDYKMGSRVQFYPSIEELKSILTELKLYMLFIGK